MPPDGADIGPVIATAAASGGRFGREPDRRCQLKLARCFGFADRS